MSTRGTLPEFNGPLTIDADFGIAGDGTAYYSITSGSTRVFYRHDFDGRTKLVGTGDEMLGSKVRQFLGGRTNSPSVWFDEDGTALVCVLLEDNSQQYLSFAPHGKMTALRVTSQTGILWRHPEQGVLLYANPYNNKGNGAHLWQGDQLKPVYVFGRRLFDQTIQEIESGTVDKQGNLTLMLRGDSSAFMVARMNPEPYILFYEGDQIPVELPVNAFTFISDALRLAGGENVFADRDRRFPLAADLGQAVPKPSGTRDTRYPRVTLEEVIARKPEIILLPDEPHPFSPQDARVFEAVPGARVIFCSGRDLCWYGARSIEGIPRLRAVLR